VRVLVLDAEKRTAVPVVRSLGRRGDTVIAASPDPWAAGARSRFAASRRRSPEPRGEAYVRWVLEAARRERVDVILPMAEATSMLLLQRRDEVEAVAHLPRPSVEAYRIALDKALVHELAVEMDIPVPRGVVARTVEEVVEATEEMGLPSLVKRRTGAGGHGMTFLSSPADVAAFRAGSAVPPEGVLVQEMIPNGGAVGVSFLYDRDGHVRATLTHRRVREFPLEGGNCSLAETTRHPRAEAAARALLDRLGWYGCAMVEFRIDPRDGSPRLLEINPRFWGTVALAIAAGVDFPALLMAVIEGKDFPVPDYPVGVRSRFLSADLMHFLVNPDRMRMRPSFFAFRDPDTHPVVWDPDDPVPAVAMYLSDASAALRAGRVRSITRVNETRPDRLPADRPL
jgi:predicted ATP-grasp superfamily ATP-dependent carboligase